MNKNIKIRTYQKSDFKMVCSWWIDSKEVGPNEGMMPLESSFIAEIDDIPALAVTVYLTNSKEVAYTENFIGNPKVKGDKRKEAAIVLSDHIFNFVKSYGYKRLMCMTEKPILVSRYKELGYFPTLSGLTTLVRDK